MRDELKALGYQVIDASNPVVEVAWIVRCPGVSDRVFVAASEDEGWSIAEKHHAHTPGTLEERLRAMVPTGFSKPIGAATAHEIKVMDNGTPVSVSTYAGANDVMRLRNPDGPEAVDEIASLRARVEVQRDALIEAEIVFGLVEHPSFADPDYQGRIESLGSEIGYGAMMAGASAAWRKSGIIPGGEFVAGPCQATITRTLEIIRQALKDSDNAE